MNALHSVRSLAILAIFASATMMGQIATATDRVEAPSDEPAPSNDAEALIEGSRVESVPPAEASLGFDLSWHTIDGGGGTSTGGGFTLSGTIGQPDAGAMSGGDFALVGGFWAGGAAADPGPTCTGDLNGDGVVNVSDLLLLFDSWGSCPGCPADFNGDGVVNVSDLLILFDNWGACP
jgi:hypothetical protein